LDERDGARMVKKIEEIVPVLLGIYIFLNPFPHTTAVKEFCYYGAVALALALWVTTNRALVFKTPLTFPLGLFVFWAFLSIFFAFDKSNSLHDFRAHLLKYVVLYFIMVTYYNTRERLSILAWTLIGSGALFSSCGLIWYYFVLDHSFDAKFGIGIFSEIPPNLIGVTTIFCVILAVHKAFFGGQAVLEGWRCALCLSLVDGNYHDTKQSHVDCSCCRFGNFIAQEKNSSDNMSRCNFGDYIGYTPEKADSQWGRPTIL